MAASWDYPLTFICAGRLTVGPNERDGGKIPNTFHVLRLEGRLDTTSAFGCLETFEYSPPKNGWEKIQQRSDYVPLNPNQKFGTYCEKPKKVGIAKNVVEVCILNSTEKFPKLPKHSELCLALQQMPYDQLNELIDEQARLNSYQLFKGYPNDTDEYGYLIKIDPS